MVRQVLEERDRNGPFLSFEDFAKRVPKRACNSRNRTSLYHLGAFSSFTDSPDKFIEDYTSLPIFEETEAQQEFLGYTIPTRRVMAMIEKFSKGEFVSGFVRAWKDKKNKKGQTYRVFYLSPEGSFWLRDDFEKYEEGDFLVVQKTSWGLGKKVKKVSV
jgi:DNA polymerase III alpha subunit